MSEPAGVSAAEVRRMVEREVARQLPAIPAQVAKLDHHQRPLVRPDVATDADVLVYSRATDDWVPGTGVAGPTGPAGPTGATGATGATGPPGTDPSVIAPVSETWNVKLVDVVIDPANLASDTAQTITVSISGLLVGDYCFFIGSTSTTSSQIFATIPVCTVNGQIQFKQFNANNNAVDVGSNTFSFFVIHRS